MSRKHPPPSGAVEETLEITWTDRPQAGASEGPPIPGLIMITHAGSPLFAAAPLLEGRLSLGRGSKVGQHLLEDGWISRQHAEIALTPQGWLIADVGSRNGSAIDGVALQNETRVVEQPRVIRLGNSLFLARRDIRPFLLSPPALRRGMVMGPALQKIWGEIARAAHFGTTLHITGESGAGKELAARAFHEQGPRSTGSFVAVNCATIPPNLAERLLFGARKGAYSGANADAKGYVSEAHKGTLFLDEVAELDAAVQAKLLRVLENREVMPLGASKPTPVDLHICSATHRDLRDAVSTGGLREDLYFRLSQPQIALPPLRDRPEEIPMLVIQAVDRITLEAANLGREVGAISAHISLLEACMLRHWPGNIRELMAEVSAAVQAALAEGSTQVESHHLRASAGTAFSSGVRSGISGEITGSDPSVSGLRRMPTADQTPPPVGGAKRPDKNTILAALLAEGGNVSSTARRLGMHRTQLRRLIERYGIDPKTL